LFTRCLVNCELKFSASVKLSIQSQCYGPQCSKITSYQWILYKQYPSATNNDTVWRKIQDLQFITSTPLDSSSIVIKGNTLDGGKNYRLVVFVQTTDGTPGMSAHDISSASPPTGGTCFITPSSGISLKTDFNLTCSDWKSESTPLSYQFQYQLENGLYSLVYHGLNSTVISWLPGGKQAVKFVVIVTDKYGASAPATNLSVQVVYHYDIIFNNHYIKLPNKDFTESTMT